MADFNLFLPILLKHEGGFVNNPADPGGATNKGITLATFTEFADKLLHVAPTLENLKAMSDASAGVIYKFQYWDKTFADEIALQDLANIIVDFRVNAGANAIKLLQRVLNDLGATPALAVDGGMGPTSLKCLQATDQVAIYRKYRAGRIDYYNQLVQNQPSLKPFLTGWMNRVNSFPQL